MDVWDRFVCGWVCDGDLLKAHFYGKTPTEMLFFNKTEKSRSRAHVYYLKP